MTSKNIKKFFPSTSEQTREELTAFFEARHAEMTERVGRADDLELAELYEDFILEGYIPKEEDLVEMFREFAPREFLPDYDTLVEMYQDGIFEDAPDADGDFCSEDHICDDCLRHEMENKTDLPS
jgi:hypothetical protein